MYDGLVLCLTTFKVIPLHREKQFQTIKAVRKNYCAHKTQKFYFEKWPMINNLNGYLYQFFATNGIFSEYDCCDDIIDFSYTNDCLLFDFQLHCIEDEDQNHTCCKIKVKGEFRDDLKQFLLWELQKSQIKSILFLCAGGNWPSAKEPIWGAISFETFFNQLSVGNIFTDICYYICE